ncbi:hypothetical protein [endosymbiont GvMRE of Glomus versiforme]|uniref:helix-hairpin-helix domain-containing protein n=1 Tax=endosymbiont GvMRE of Glomus versiforme TaxID=2039283 RepID=UPI000EC606A4|nr:hypothetical protein [endosymbiont GvMRE of Glomus versiforme]RHZ36439.1 DNA-directed DNA polymerase [endosymbiont GvMRE of Glomus versiforme]
MDKNDNKNASLLPNEEVENFKKNFLQQCQKKLSRAESEKLWGQIINSSAYTFNKSHAVAYSYLSYYFAFLKANYFTSLITYFLNSYVNSSEKTLAYLREAIFFGFVPHSPDINFSEIQWSQRGKILQMGFANLENSQPAFFEAIITERKKKGKFRDWEDFLHRTSNHWKKIELNDFQRWTETGLFASLKINTSDLLENSETVLSYCQLKQIFPNTSRFLPTLDWIQNKQDDQKELTQSVFLNSDINKKEWENWGIYLNYFSVWKEKKKTMPIQAFAEFSANSKKPVGQETIQIYAILQELQKKGNFFSLTLFDLRSTFKLFINTEFYQKNKEILVIHQAIVFHLAIRIDNYKIQNIKVVKVEL